MNVSHNRLKNLDGLQSCVLLQRLNVGYNRIEDIDAVGKCSILEEFIAAGNRLSLVKLAVLKVLVNLKVLLLEGNAIDKSKDMFMIGYLPQLGIFNRIKVTDAIRQVGCKTLQSMESKTILKEMNKIRLHPTSECHSKPATIAKAGRINKQEKDDTNRTMKDIRSEDYDCQPFLPIDAVQVKQVQKPAGKKLSILEAVSGLPSISKVQSLKSKVSNSIYYKNGQLAVQTMADGSSMAKWPNGKLAVSMDYSNHGYRMYAGTSSGKGLLSLDHNGIGFINYNTSANMITVTKYNGGTYRSEDGQIRQQWNNTNESLPLNTIQLVHHLQLAYSVSNGRLEIRLTFTLPGLNQHYMFHSTGKHHRVPTPPDSIGS